MKKKAIVQKPAELSPMMKQYWDIKNRHKGELLFYRLGDFYEMFFDDAIVASRELELTLTGRDCGLSERAPMCGVPYHSCDAYIARLIEKGYRVAICEQMESPREAKGIVRRDIIRVVTPGTILENNMLDEGQNNFIASLCEEEGVFGCAFADVSTGEVHACLLTGEAPLQNELSRFSPSEVLLGGAVRENREILAFMQNKLSCSVAEFDFESVTGEESERDLPAQFGAANLELLSLGGKWPLQKALCGLLRYLRETQRRGMETLGTLDIYSKDEYMALDITACRNLELTSTIRAGERRGSLLWVLDKTKTAMGRRLLRSWLEKPLLSGARITRRQNAVAELFDNTVMLGEITGALGGVFDLERLIARIVYGNASPRELSALKSTADKLPGIRELLCDCRSQYLADIYTNLDPLLDIAALIENAISDDPPQNLKDGGVIKPGYSEELDELRELIRGAKGFIAKLETEERAKTGIKALKIGYNRVFGYYIEISKSYQSMAPESYIRKQTLSGCERYITQELKELEERILGASEQAESVEQALYTKVREEVCREIIRIQSAAALLARLDVFCSLARVSVENKYCRPQVNLSGDIVIKGGRHPVVEQVLEQGGQFVSNDVSLDMGRGRISVITGPNMSGKSTYMRMTALIVIMAQIGCFVPAASADITVVDGVYTRVGASDDLSLGQSTFMVEMSEVASILKSATKNSLLILDEIGRGTSTFDGMSIARAVVEYIADPKRLGAKAMFATHYHELTELEETLDCVRNYNVAVVRQGEDVIFLRRIVRGGADDSYGIYVSKLAGIPESVIRRAETILKALEAGETPSSHKKKKREESESDGQIVIRQSDDSEITRRLKEIDLDTVTPLSAINILAELKMLL